MNYIRNVFVPAILAGIFISIGGFVNLAVGSYLGAFLFALGLCAVCVFGTPLFTGKAGFVEMKWNGILFLIVVLFGNILGCYLMSLVGSASNMNLTEAADKIVNVRLTNGWLRTGVLSIGCGIIMTVCVKAYLTQKTFIPILIGIPTFILCGFPHCVADVFYYFMMSGEMAHNLYPAGISIYAATVVGNFIGCNVPRVLGPR